MDEAPCLGHEQDPLLRSLRGCGAPECKQRGADCGEAPHRGELKECGYRPAQMAPSLLFLGDPSEDYVADSLFHGLRALLGGGIVDYPKRNPLYESSTSARTQRLYGRGFGIYGLLEDIDVE